MLTRTALVSWAVGAVGLALEVVFWRDDLVVVAGIALVILGPLIALTVVIRERTPEAMFVFLLALVSPVLLGLLFYLVARNAG